MRRVMVVGCSGAGKSTFAKQLGRLTGLPVVHLDQLHWRPGWVATDPQEFEQAQRDAVTQREWIIDGNYSPTMEIRLLAADTVIWLDYPRRLCLYRAVRRYAAHRHRTREDMASDCPEQMDWEFVRWIWGYPKRSRPGMLARFANLRPDQRLTHFHRPREAARFLEGLSGDDNVFRFER